MIIKILFQWLIILSLILFLPIVPPAKAVAPFSPLSSAIAQTDTFLSELSGKREAYKKVSLQGGFAEAKVNFFREGIAVFETQAKSNSNIDSVQATVFAVGSDVKG